MLGGWWEGRDDSGGESDGYGDEGLSWEAVLASVAAPASAEVDAVEEEQAAAEVPPPPFPPFACPMLVCGPPPSVYELDGCINHCLPG